MVNSVMESFGKFIEVLNNKMSNEQNIMTLRPIDDGPPPPPPPPPQPYFSSSEMFNCAKIFALGCAFALVGIGISAATSKLAGAISSRLGAMSTSSGILGQLYGFFIAIGPAGIGSLMALVNSCSEASSH